MYTGLFTLEIDTSSQKGVVEFPWLALDAFAPSILIAGAVTATSYSWNSMELIAIHSIRCGWNAIWYSYDDCWVSAKDLRFGAHCNPNCVFTKGQINCELNQPVILAETYIHVF